MDKYDKAIEYLNNYPEEIYDAWEVPGSHPAGCLFQYVGPSCNGNIGCLTMIRGSDGYVAITNELTVQIKNDDRIPTAGENITLKDLSIFAEYQRQIDLVVSPQVSRS